MSKPCGDSLFHAWTRSLSDVYCVVARIFIYAGELCVTRLSIFVLLYYLFSYWVKGNGCNLHYSEVY